jgi:hypothetical protein
MLLKTNWFDGFKTTIGRYNLISCRYADFAVNPAPGSSLHLHLSVRLRG